MTFIGLVWWKMKINENHRNWAQIYCWTISCLNESAIYEPSWLSSRSQYKHIASPIVVLTPEFNQFIIFVQLIMTIHPAVNTFIKQEHILHIKTVNWVIRQWAQSYANILSLGSRWLQVVQHISGLTCWKLTTTWTPTQIRRHRSGLCA